jgi:hypothetical protein
MSAFVQRRNVIVMPRATSYPSGWLVGVGVPLFLFAMNIHLHFRDTTNSGFHHRSKSPFFR